MQTKRRVFAVGMTFFLAAATGHIMQSGETFSARLRDSPNAPVVAQIPAKHSVLSDAMLVSGTISAPVRLPNLPSAGPRTLASGQLLATRVGGLGAGYSWPKTDADANYSAFGIACAPSQMALAPMDLALLKLTLRAPCYPNEKVVISHAGLTFAVATGPGGELDLTLPALTDDGMVSVYLAEGESLSARHDVTGLQGLRRLALQWRDGSDLHLYAFENGAGTNDTANEVSAKAPHQPLATDGGFLTVLGDPTLDHPMLAEVYTASVGTDLADLRIEASVSGTNCARTLRGETLRMVPGEKPHAAALSFAMPGCDAVGDYLVMSLAPIFEPSVALALEQQ